MSEPLVIDQRRLDRAPAAPSARDAARATRSAIEIAIHHQLDAVEAEWRRFEQTPIAPPFQAFDWLAAWCRHVGPLRGRSPRSWSAGDDDGATLFILPLAVTPGVVRRLTWLGSDLCDYNGAAAGAGLFASRLTRRAVPRTVAGDPPRLQADPRTRHDLVELTKMPERVGAQANPLLALAVGLNPSDAYVADLFGTWDEFYEAKRSSATRRRDRTKLKRLGEIGEVRFVTPQDRGEIERTVDVLIEQKARSFARMGVANMFERPGWREFYAAVATDAAHARSRPCQPARRRTDLVARSISASCSATPTTTCWRATTTARRRGSGRASRICAS